MLTTCLLALALNSPVAGEVAPDATGPAREPGIAWFADWDAGLAEAQRSQRPIMLQFMRPACRGVSGVF